MNQSPMNFGGGVYTPPPLIGNIVCNTPHMNTMGGYYTNNYNPVNFYEYHKQLQQQKEEERKQQVGVSNLWKRLARGCHEVLNSDIEDMDEYLKKYDVVEAETDQQEVQMNRAIENINRVHATAVEGNVFLQREQEERYRMFQEEKQRVPDSTGLYDFLDMAGGIYLEMIISKAKEAERDVTKLYSSNQYKQLIDIHNRLVNRTTNIDDMEIQLPPSLKNNEFEARRNAFMAAIMNGG